MLRSIGRRRRVDDEQPTPTVDLLAVGLGNPGAAYAGTRHNVGADAVALLARRHEADLRLAKREQAVLGQAGIGGRHVALAVPQTFMNDSGLAVAKLVRRYGVDDPARLLIVHDELDLPVGRIKVKAGGGLAGHNGLRSVKAHLHTDAFLRIRIGIGKPPGKQYGADHVLRPPGKAERSELAVVLEEVADAIEVILADGVAAAMTRFNAP